MWLYVPRMLRRTKRILIAIHLYTGIALCGLFVTWFVSGIAMAYYRTPVIGDAARLDFAEPIRETTALAPGQVGALAATWADTDTLRLVSWNGRPLYRWHRGESGWRSAWGDTGADAVFDAPSLVGDARRWLGTESVRYDGAFGRDSQWSYFSDARDHYPLHRFSSGGVAPRQVLFSSRTGEPIVATTPGGRLLYYLGPGLHYFSIYPIRNNSALWRGLVNWSSGIGAVSCAIGLVIGLWHLRWRAIGTGRRSVPYVKPWMRWHHITGLAFGLLAFTFVLSGLFSMNPGRLFPSSDIPASLEASFQGPRADVHDLLPRTTLVLPLPGPPLKELEWKRLRGQTFIAGRRAPGDQTRFWPAGDRLIERPPFSDDELIAAVGDVLPARIRRAERLREFDNHYYARKERFRPLPVLRVELADADDTWYYVDPADGQLLLRSDTGTRLRRWLYNGLHSFDMQFLLRAGRWWDVTIWILSLAGLALSVTSCVIAWQWLRRRIAPVPTPAPAVPPARVPSVL